MKHNIIKNAALIIGAAAVITSCADKKWSAEGTIASADGKEMILEAPNAVGGWYPMDTVEIKSGGKFSVKGDPLGHPEVLRLTLGNQSLYFPVDSMENITINADTLNFASGYTLSGSESADKLQQVNDLIAKTVKEKGEQAVAYDPELKRALSEIILRDPAGIVAYYTIFKRVGNTMIFDPRQRTDLRMIGAVANAFVSERPSDPRTEFLKQLYLGRRVAEGLAVPTDTIVAQEISLPEISLLDDNGTRQSLTELSGKGKVIVVNFTSYAAQGSPALNVELARLYEAYKDRGFEIYQVSVDGDEFQWKQSARNLPWITVYNSPKDGASSLVRYNVTSVPATFIINRNGELVERVENIGKLESAVSRYL